MNAVSVSMPAAQARRARCRLCSCLLGAPDDDETTRVCHDCKTRPEARAFLSPAPSPVLTVGPPPFTHAERALIQRLHAHLPAAELLRILNERLNADRSHAAPHTWEQLREATQALVPSGQAEWSRLRRLLTASRQAGVLQTITTTTIEDFATVYQLTPAQAMHLKDVITHAREDR